MRGAAVVSRDDRRLGAVPVAVVELRPDAGPTTSEELLAELSGVLARYELPEEIRVRRACCPGPIRARSTWRPSTPSLTPRPVVGEPVTGRWTFGVDPLPQTTRLAALLRDVTGLALAVEERGPCVEDSSPRWSGPRRTWDPECRLVLRPEWVRRSRATGGCTSTTPSTSGPTTRASPSTTIQVVDERAHGTVTFPVAYEGPPGLVHGGFLALFFDCVVQHHNCEVGVAGKTTSLALRFRRPTPLLTPLAFTLERTVSGRSDPLLWVAFAR